MASSDKFCTQSPLSHMESIPTFSDYINKHDMSKTVILRQARAFGNVLRNYYNYKSTNKRNPSKEFYITCECSLECNCYSKEQKPRLPLNMCMIPTELDYFHSRQPFLPQFTVEWKCNKCQRPLNCGQMSRSQPHMNSQDTRSQPHMNYENTSLFPTT